MPGAAARPLSGQVCLVTGASRGVGKGIALQLSEAGATVYITGRHQETLEKTAAEVQGRGGRCVAAVCDSTREEDVAALFERLRKEQGGRLDVLVNNAFSGLGAVAKLMGSSFWDGPPSLWDDINNAGLRGHYIFSVYAARLMVPAGRGLIVIISSPGGLRYMFDVPYGVGKAACDRLAADCALELRPFGVACVALWPGLVRTEGVQKQAAMESGPVFQKLRDKLPIMAESVEVSGKCVVGLASDPNIMRHSGTVQLSPDLARRYHFKDVDGKEVFNYISVRNILTELMPTLSALFRLIPGFITVPKWVLSLALADNCKINHRIFLGSCFVWGHRKKDDVEAKCGSAFSVEEYKNTEDFKGEVKTDSELKVIRGKPEFEIDVFDTDMQNREEERPSEFRAEILQLPFVTVTSNKPVIGLNAGTKVEAIGQVETKKEESEISLQLPASKQTSSDIGSASSEEKRLSQNTCLLESVSEKLEHVSATETSIETHVKEKVTVEVNKVGIEKSNENISDPSKENPEKLQNESFLLGEDVESKESKAQNAVLKEDIALQKERKDTDVGVTERNVDLKKDNDFANECQLCQFDTETVTMIEQLVDQRPRKAQLGKHFPDSGNSENKQRRSREDQSRDDFNATVHHPREDDDHSPAAGHHRDDHSPADSGHPRDDPSPAVLQPRDNISLTEDFT
ncbi:UNVERIFIED_CONTAM: hypothetical protein K2H54_070377 [Gekko kuhli]